MRTVVRYILVSAIAVLCASSAALAQVQTGSILVKSVDEQGGVVPGATVTVSSPVLVSGTQSGVTDPNGVYRFVSLPPGTYSLKVELSGFQTTSREGVVVGAGNTTPIDVALRVGNLSETMTVTGESPV